MLRPEDVRLGRREQGFVFSDCVMILRRLTKNMIAGSSPSKSHPVDYFYDWMVEILAGGDPQALGEYPYPSPVLRR